MKKAFKHSFFERGYGQFPYIIIRQHPNLYLQIPLHSQSCRDLNLDGIYISDLDILQTKNFDEACKLRFHKLWSAENRRGGPVDMCLVLNSHTGYYISKNGMISETSIPSGGLLLSMDDSFIQMNGEHYFLKI